MVARQRVGNDGGVSVPDMGRVVDVVNRGRDIEGTFHAIGGVSYSVGTPGGASPSGSSGSGRLGAPPASGAVAMARVSLAANTLADPLDSPTRTRLRSTSSSWTRPSPSGVSTRLPSLGRWRRASRYWASS